VSTHVGRQAEVVAADYLRRHGFTVLEQNWRTRWCEIDIVAQKASVLYFVEVKYRGRTDWGGGLEYVTRRKVRQMYFAAQFWMAQQSSSADYRLAAVELTGSPPYVTQCVRVT
jgi:uncharacterized protein (TIGR00252 family)